MSFLFPAYRHAWLSSSNQYWLQKKQQPNQLLNEKETNLTRGYQIWFVMLRCQMLLPWLRLYLVAPTPELQYIPLQVHVLAIKTGTLCLPSNFRLITGRCTNSQKAFRI